MGICIYALYFCSICSTRVICMLCFYNLQSELFTSTSRLFINFLLFFLKRAIKVCLLYHTGVDFDFQQLNFPHSWIQLTIYHGFRALFLSHT